MHLRHTTGIDSASHLKTLDLFPSKSFHLDRKASDQHHRLGVQVSFTILSSFPTLVAGHMTHRSCTSTQPADQLIVRAI
jgi:hypothetical protein